MVTHTPHTIPSAPLIPSLHLLIHDTSTASKQKKDALQELTIACFQQKQERHLDTADRRYRPYRSAPKHPNTLPFIMVQRPTRQNSETGFTTKAGRDAFRFTFHVSHFFFFFFLFLRKLDQVRTNNQINGEERFYLPLTPIITVVGWSCRRQLRILS